jgi:hypothetical protein
MLNQRDAGGELEDGSRFDDVDRRACFNSGRRALSIFAKPAINITIK